MTFFDEKTLVTQSHSGLSSEKKEGGTDCLVIIYTKEPTLLGKRFVLEHNPTRIGRGVDNQIVLDGDSVSRRHAHVEKKGIHWIVADDGSTNGTYLNDIAVPHEALLNNGDRIKIGATIFKFLSGTDVEAKYHEEIYQMTIIDGLTQIYNKRYYKEALEKEMVRSRRYDRPLSMLMFDLDHFKRINDSFGHLAGDFVLKEIARIVQARIRRDEIFARFGGEEFVILLPETNLEGAISLAETLRHRVMEYTFVFQSESIRVTISIGVASVNSADRTSEDLLLRSDERLYCAKNSGRNIVCS